MTIIDAMTDENLFRPFFRDLFTWRAWIVALKGIFALPIYEDEAALFREHTGRQELPEAQAREAWFIVGRRGGKSRIAALIAVFLACFRSYKKVLSPGERGVVMVLACDRHQAKVLLRYIAGCLESVPMLSRLVERRTEEAIDLTNGISLEVHTASFRAVRGRTVVAALLDELAFWRSEESTNPDVEILNAIRPAMATVPGAMLLGISSPYRRAGVLWEAFREHYGQEGDVLVWKASTQQMNPEVPEEVIARAYQEDEAVASAEYGAEFRADLEAFISREAVEGCIISGRRELPVVSGVSYCGFVDPSGGSADGFTLAISHSDGGVRVLDVVREVRPPFSPEAVVEQYAELLKRYGIRSVFGDRYAGEWPREQFRKHGVDYVPSERSKSEIYLELLPPLNSGRIELLDHDRLVQQLVRLERRTSRSGKDSVDHAPGGHDDLINAAAGALVNAQALGPFLPDDIENYIVRAPGHVPIGEELRMLPDDPGADHDVL